MLQQSLQTAGPSRSWRAKRLIQVCYIGPIRGALTAYRHQQQIFALLTREKLDASGPHGREKIFGPYAAEPFMQTAKGLARLANPFRNTD